MEIKSPTDVGRCVCARRKTTTYDDHLNQSPASAWGPLKPSYSSYDYTIWGGGGGPRPRSLGAALLSPRALPPGNERCDSPADGWR